MARTVVCEGAKAPYTIVQFYQCPVTVVVKVVTIPSTLSTCTSTEDTVEM